MASRHSEDLREDAGRMGIEADCGTEAPRTTLAWIRGRYAACVANGSLCPFEHPSPRRRMVELPTSRALAVDVSDLWPPDAGRCNGST